MEPIRLMLVDDHDVLRAGLRSLLEGYPDMNVVAEAGDGVQAVEQIANVCPDVVVMDISMPQMDGLEATRRLRSQCPQSQVLALTVHEDKQYFFEMLAAGAAGYVTKRAAADELVSAIRAVAAGNAYLQPALARWLLDDYHRISAQLTEADPKPDNQAASGRVEQLSMREQQVVELVADGMTNPKIGARLGISPKTVARHRERIMKKLNLQSSAELVKFAIRTGLIEL